MNARPALAALVVLAGALAAGCTHPSDDGFRVASGGGGGVSNVPTWFQVFSATPTTVLNDGTGFVTYSMTFLDNNSESDIVYLGVFSNATGYLGYHSVTSADRSAANEPASFGSDGWKVWTGTSGDGVLYAKHKQTIASGATPATLTMGVATTDATGATNYPPPAMQIAITIRAPSVISVASAPVNAAGTAQTGSSWGAWTANPGDTNVVSANYLKLTNTGAYPTPTVVVDFSNATFTGASDATWTVPLDTNVQFAWWEDTTPSSTAPNQGTYSWLPASTEGSVTINFHASGNIVYVTYRVVALPSTLATQSYTASYTTTDITP